MCPPPWAEVPRRPCRPGQCNGPRRKKSPKNFFFVIFFYISFMNFGYKHIWICTGIYWKMCSSYFRANSGPGPGIKWFRPGSRPGHGNGPRRKISSKKFLFGNFFCIYFMNFGYKHIWICTEINWKMSSSYFKDNSGPGPGAKWSWPIPRPGQVIDRVEKNRWKFLFSQFFLYSFYEFWI